MVRGIVSLRSPILFSTGLLLLGSLTSLLARDFGVQGSVTAIAEEDPREVILQKLKAMEASGALKEHQKMLLNRTKKGIQRPHPLESITKATNGRVFFYDPTYSVPEDIQDHLGKILIPKGTRINPLETVFLSQILLFLDGDDEDQVTWAQEKLKQGPCKLILTRGAPLALSERLGIPVYFDQSGALTQKLSIKHIPTEVRQEEIRLRIEEVLLEKPQ